MLRFEPVSGLVVAFTETFRIRQKAFVGIAAAAAKRTRSSSRDAAIRLLSLKEFKADFQNQPYRSKRWMKKWSILYEDSEFNDLMATIPPEQHEVIRPLKVFFVCGTVADLPNAFYPRPGGQSPSSVGFRHFTIPVHSAVGWEVSILDHVLKKQTAACICYSCVLMPQCVNFCSLMRRRCS